MRTHKDNVRYYYDSDSNLIALAKGNTTLFFYYDDSGNPTSFSDGTNMYYYVKNIQGDIVKIISSTGTVVANYAYNVWGELLYIKDTFGNSITDTSNIAFLNPLRYRGYVYDDETDLYYLQSRYYDPVTCKFINADIYCDTNSDTPFSTNMFAYCENNAISRIDTNGNWYSTLNSYAQYRNNLRKLYQYYDSYYYVNSWYRQMSISYGHQYAIAKSRYEFISKHYYYNIKKVSKFNTYIYGQKNYPYSDFYFGASNVYSHGCGSVALFNVLHKLGHTTHLAQIIMEMELNMMLKDNGAGGTLNSTYPDFLKAHGIKYDTYNQLNTFSSNIKKYKISMVIIPDHIFCLIPINGGLRSINYHDYAKGFETFTLSKMPETFISAYGIK